jgi:hypothetical protein
MHAGSSVCVLTGMGIAHDSVMKAQSPPHPKPGRKELGPAAQSLRAKFARGASASLRSPLDLFGRHFRSAADRQQRMSRSLVSRYLWGGPGNQRR